MKRTPLYDAHHRLGAKLVPFAGWEMPVEYSGIISEHNAVRTAAGLFDVSHMGEFEIRGSGAAALLQFVTSNDVERLQPGQAQYSALPTPEGTVVDDLLVYRIEPELFMLVVNAGNIDKDFAWIAEHNHFGARVEDVSDRTALISLQGPKAIAILQPLANVDLAPIPYYRFVRGAVNGTTSLVSRTGYTGEDGFEIYLAAAQAESVWERILEAGRPSGLSPAGLGARNTLRLESKMLLYGNDMDEATTMIEAGLGSIVRFDKGDFIGRAALERQKREGVSRTLVGFEMLGREIARDGYPALVGGEVAGRVTSGAPSITLKKNIGLAYLPRDCRTPGTPFQVSIRGRAVDARVAATPFYKRRDS